MDKRKAKRDKKDRKKRAKQRVDDALDAAKTVLDLFSDAAGETGVPGLQTGVGGLVALLTLLKVRRSFAAISRLLPYNYDRKPGRMPRTSNS